MGSLTFLEVVYTTVAAPNIIPTHIYVHFAIMWQLEGATQSESSFMDALDETRKSWFKCELSALDEWIIQFEENP